MSCACGYGCGSSCKCVPWLWLRLRLRLPLQLRSRLQLPLLLLRLSLFAYGRLGQAFGCFVICAQEALHFVSNSLSLGYSQGLRATGVDHSIALHSKEGSR
mmetsp:Transcript_25647/g.51743  ORF Transcript_25647/g.51743 Transcript_25647/m.51743 type:complete len:101 (+) Transcript_25647:718-1020(+)